MGAEDEFAHGCNLISSQPLAFGDQYIPPAMFRRSFVLLVLLPCSPAAAQAPGPLREQLAARVARAPATVVGVYYKSLSRPDSLLLGANLRFHAASTMKVPVMVQIFRDADEGLLRLDDSLAVRATFPSLVDGSPFEVDKADDSDSTLYRRGGGEASIREVLELMITRSSKLATKLLTERVRAARAQEAARGVGAWSNHALRGRWASRRAASRTTSWRPGRGRYARGLAFVAENAHDLTDDVGAGSDHQ